MSLQTNVKSAADSAVEQISARFPDLPKPLLAAIGAGDVAIERLASLRQQLSDQVPTTGADRADAGVNAGDLPKLAHRAVTEFPSRARKAASELPEKVQKAATELPGKARKAASELPEKVQKAASDLPGTAQRAAAELPDKLQKAAGDLPVKVQKAAGDLPAKAQAVATDIAESLQGFAATAPAMAQKLIAELPAKAAEFRGNLTRDNIKNTLDAYTQLVAMIYGSLAERGGKAVAKAQPGTPNGKPAAPTGGAGTSESDSTDDVERGQDGHGHVDRSQGQGTTSQGRHGRDRAGCVRSRRSEAGPEAGDGQGGPEAVRQGGRRTQAGRAPRRGRPARRGDGTARRTRAARRTARMPARTRAPCGRHPRGLGARRADGVEPGRGTPGRGTAERRAPGELTSRTVITRRAITRRAPDRTSAVRRSPLSCGRSVVRPRGPGLARPASGSCIDGDQRLSGAHVR